MAAFGAISLFCLALAWSAIVSGFTLSVLWGWFIVGTFGLPALSIAQAIGVGLVVKVARGVRSNHGKNDKPFMQEIALAIIGLPLICAFVLLMGYIAKQFA